MCHRVFELGPQSKLSSLSPKRGGTCYRYRLFFVLHENNCLVDVLSMKDLNFEQLIDACLKKEVITSRSVDFGKIADVIMSYCRRLFGLDSVFSCVKLASIDRPRNIYAIILGVSEGLSAMLWMREKGRQGLKCWLSGNILK